MIIKYDRKVFSELSLEEEPSSQFITCPFFPFVGRRLLLFSHYSVCTINNLLFISRKRNKMFFGFVIIVFVFFFFVCYYYSKFFSGSIEFEYIFLVSKWRKEKN